MGRVTNRYRVLRMADGVATARPDTLAAEEPLEIRVAGRPLTVTMRTPGDDFDLARGFLVSEGVVASDSDIAAIRYCAGATADGGNTYNVLDVLLADGVPLPDPSVERNFYTTSSCGLCGKASLEAVRTISKWRVDSDPLRLDRRDDRDPAGETQGGSAGLRPHGRAARGRTVRCERGPVVRSRRRRPAQRGGQGHRLGARRRAPSAERHHADGQWPGFLRTGAEGSDGRDSGPGRGVRAVVTRR